MRSDYSIGLISLGCDKNRVDSERMLYLLADAGYKLTENSEEADVMVVNTCAFIEAAKKEAISNIFDVADLKQDQLKGIVVTGCFTNRYKDEAAESIPEVDAWLNVNEEDKIVEVVDKILGVNEKYECGERLRVITTPPHYAYLRIADGCNKQCTYCAIPSIRGKYKSEPIEKLIEEAQWLYKNGVRELILVAQDTTAYGMDLYKRFAIVDLLKELVKIDFWKIRIMYTYPELVTDELIDFIASNDKMAKYLDIPMQHIDDNLLKAMARPSDENKINTLINKIRSKDKYIAIRSTFIVGFPGENQELNKKLQNFLKDKLDYAGFFVYSPEEGTKAFSMPNRALKKDAKKWKADCEKIQVVSTVNKQSRFKDEIVDVIYEGIDFAKGMFYGRTEYCAPEIDTKVFFKSEIPLDVGNVYKVKITKTDFNLYGNVVLQGETDNA